MQISILGYLITDNKALRIIDIKYYIHIYVVGTFANNLVNYVFCMLFSDWFQLR